MTKELNKAIMKRSKRRNKFLTKETLDARIAYDKQRNLCVNLLWWTKKTYFPNVNINSVTNKKQNFGKLPKHFSPIKSHTKKR